MGRRNWVIDQRQGYTLAGLPGGNDIAMVPGFRTYPRVYVLSLLLVAATVLMTFALLVDLRQHLFQQWHDRQVPGFWAGCQDRWVIAVLAGSCVAGVGIFAWRAPVGTRVCALLLLVTLAGAADVAIVRAYYAIEGSMVTILPILPWRPVIRFRLADATVIRRGCTHTPGRIARSALVFEVRYGREPNDTIDLGSGVDTGNAAQWLDEMRAYRSGGLRLPPTSAKGVPHDDLCLGRMTAELSETQADALERLLD